MDPSAAPLGRNQTAAITATGLAVTAGVRAACVSAVTLSRLPADSVTCEGAARPRVGRRPLDVNVAVTTATMAADGTLIKVSR